MAQYMPINNNEICTICVGSNTNLEKSILLECGHTYHVACLTQVLINAEEYICPICNKPLNLIIKNGILYKLSMIGMCTSYINNNRAVIYMYFAASVLVLFFSIMITSLIYTVCDIIIFGYINGYTKYILQINNSNSDSFINIIHGLGSITMIMIIISFTLFLIIYLRPLMSKIWEFLTYIYNVCQCNSIFYQQILP